MPLAAAVTAITILARTARRLIGPALTPLAIAVTRRPTTLIAITAPTVAALACLLRGICGGGLATSLRRRGRCRRSRPIGLAIAAIATPIASMTAMTLALALLSAVDSAVFSAMAAARAPDLDKDLLGRRGCRLANRLRR